MPRIDNMEIFGIDELWIAPLVDNSPGTDTEPPAYGELVRLRGVSSFSPVVTAESYDLEGDNGIVTTLSRASGMEIEVEHGVARLDTLETLMGAELITSADGEQVLVRRSTDNSNHVGVIGIIYSSQTAVVIPVAKAINFEMEYSNLEFGVVSLTLKGLRRPLDNALQIIRQTPDIPVADVGMFTLPADATPAT
jgi:hypothetical protein